MLLPLLILSYSCSFGPINYYHFMMRILDFNDNYLLASNNYKTFLLQSPSLAVISECIGTFRLGSLQYSTGIAALGASSQVRFHDFKYDRKLQQIETVLKLVNLKIVKNLLFCISLQRVLIYDIATKSNLCHIPTSNGELATLSCDYYNLKLLYQVSENVYHEQQIWKNRTKKIECIPCSALRYDKSGDILCLVQDNVIAIYQNQQIIRGCSFQDHITTVTPSVSVPHKFYAKTERKGDDPKIFYVEVSVANKFYLKLEQEVGESPLSAEEQLHFEYKGTLMVWRQNKVYKTEIDLEPKLGGSINEWQKQKKYQMRVSNLVIENSAQQQRLEAEYLKQIENQMIVQEEEEKLSRSKKLQQGLKQEAKQHHYETVLDPPPKIEGQSSRDLQIWESQKSQQ